VGEALDTAERVARELRGSPLIDIGQARQHPRERGVPAESGFYAWWCEIHSVPSGISAPRHPGGPFALLYVGIAPRNAASKAVLRSRICGQHIGGNTASSTFRFGLASLLWEEQRWHPCVRARNEYLLPPSENQALSEWQRENLRLRWLVAEEPWAAEDAVVHELEAPMNREHNAMHASYSLMGQARDRFRAAARTNGPCGSQLE
jgi:hypothetical protein